ncbi:MAG: response regulator [Clostridia bacterium]|nr:response regulator [Clostridia bacterium]
MKRDTEREIAGEIYWVGDQQASGDMRCNPYLLIDGNEAVLFDPGSVLDFEKVISNVKEIVPLRKIKYVVLSHQDPDLCSCLPMLEKENTDFKIVTHWRTKILIKYYGVKSEFYMVDENDYKLKLKSGREIQFIPTPYLHFPGAIASYDIKSKTLFSGDLFGSMESSEGIFADESYITGMRAFHENYMPSTQIMRPVMETFLLMGIETIAPQHGLVINKNVKDYITILRNLECGIFLNSVKKSVKDYGGYGSICSLIIKKYTDIFSDAEILEALSGMNIETGDRPFEILSYGGTGLQLWENLFEAIFNNKGIKWLIIIESLVEKICKEYDMPFPEIMVSEFIKSQEEAIVLRHEVEALKMQSSNADQSILSKGVKTSRCAITGLYSQVFFMEYLKMVIDSEREESESPASIILIDFDDLTRIKTAFGQEEYDNALKSMSYILKHERKSGHMLFRLDSGIFAYLCSDISKEGAVEIAENIRNEVRNSKKFIDEMTISEGVADYAEIEGMETESKSKAVRMYEAALLRLRMAKNRGGDIVVSDTDILGIEYDNGKVLIADSDETNRNVLKAYLENREYNVLTAADGEEAAELAYKELPELIISEIMLPKMDGFLLRENLLHNSYTKNIPFIVISNLKNENSLKRAFGLGITHYLKKPYMIVEILGIVDSKLKEKA